MFLVLALDPSEPERRMTRQTCAFGPSAVSWAVGGFGAQRERTGHTFDATTAFGTVLLDRVGPLWNDPGPLPDFTCQACQKPFSVTEEVLARFPGWNPKLCMTCKKNKASGTASRAGGATTAKATAFKSVGTRKGGVGSATRELDLPVAEILKRYTDGPQSGVFTDGAANPHPGPGGWGVVYVESGEIRGEQYGTEPHTTNNRMELLALRAGIALVPSGTQTTLYTDSQLCVNTFNTWAKAWKARGWKRKDGAIKNLELVQEIYDALQQRPELTLEWIAAHSGYRWNEYADALATAYRRSVK